MSHAERGVLVVPGIGGRVILLLLGALLAVWSGPRDVLTVDVMPTDAPANVPTLTEIVTSPTRVTTKVNLPTNTVAPTARLVSPSAPASISLTSTPTLA